MQDFELHTLPIRALPRPRTSNGLPHKQEDQLPSAEQVELLLSRALAMPNVGTRESRIATPGVVALHLSDTDASGPRDAFIDDHEFCHLHPNGALHVAVSQTLTHPLIRSGWAEQHVMAKAGLLPPTVLLVYAPRDDFELDVVLWVIQESMEYARGRR